MAQTAVAAVSWRGAPTASIDGTVPGSPPVGLRGGLGDRLNGVLFAARIAGASPLMAALWFVVCALCTVPTLVTPQPDGIGVIHIVVVAETLGIWVCHWTLRKLTAVIDGQGELGLVNELNRQHRRGNRLVVVVPARARAASAGTEAAPPANPTFARADAYLVPCTSNKIINYASVVAVIGVPAASLLINIVLSVTTGYWDHWRDREWRDTNLPIDRSVLATVFYTSSVTTIALCVIALRMVRVAMNSWLARSMPGGVAQGCGRRNVTVAGGMQKPEDAADELICELAPLVQQLGAALLVMYVVACVALTIVGILWFLVATLQPGQSSRYRSMLTAWVPLLVLLFSLLLTNSWLAPAVAILQCCSPSELVGAIHGSQWLAATSECHVCGSPRPARAHPPSSSTSRGGGDDFVVLNPLALTSTRVPEAPAAATPELLQLQAEAWDRLHTPTGRAHLLRWYTELLVRCGPLAQVKICGFIVDNTVVTKAVVGVAVSLIVPAVLNMAKSPPAWLLNIKGT